MAQQIHQLLFAVDAARAFEIALEIGINQDVLEGDSEMVIHALANEAPYWSIFGNFIEHARFFFFFNFFFNSFRWLSFSHTKREGNRLAHNLAKHSISFSHTPSCFSS